MLTSLDTASAAEAGYDLEELNYQLDRVKTEAFLNSNSAFLGPLMCGMDFVWTLDIPTAATDGATIWWSPKDFMELTPALRKSTLLHELWHPGNLHLLRRGERDPKIWNIAADIDINNGLKKDGYTIEKPYFIWDKQYEGWAVEDIYDALQKQCAPWGAGGAQGDPQHGQGQALPGQGPGQPGDGQPGSGDGPTGDRNAGSDMFDNPSPEVAQKAINNVIQAAHAATAANQAGSIPGHTKLAIKKFLTPVVPWEILLDRFLEERSNEDFSWRRPNRRYQDMYLPCRESNDRLAHLIFYEDVSGSISDRDCQRFNSEVKHIKDKYNPEKLTLVQFDTRITTEVTLTENDPFDEVVIVGRGGTCLKEVREHMMKHEPTAAVVFSDMHVAPMEPGPKCPILWIAIENKQATVPFGTLIHIRP